MFLHNIGQKNEYSSKVGSSEHDSNQIFPTILVLKNKIYNYK